MIEKYTGSVDDHDALKAYLAKVNEFITLLKEKYEV